MWNLKNYKNLSNNSFYSITNYLDANYICKLLYKLHNTKNIIINRWYITYSEYYFI